MIKQILQKHTILYAEDNKSLQKTTVEYLRRYFEEVYVANNGEEAFALYSIHKPDALLLDIDMPLMDGLEVARNVRQLDASIPIMMMTAFTDTNLLLKAVELNLCRYLVKPVALGTFKDALQNLSERLMIQRGDVIQLKEGYVWFVKEQRLHHPVYQVSLKPKEKKLLHLFLLHINQLVSFEEIMAVVWEDDFEKEISLSTVKYHVSSLRNALPKDSIENVYGKGYIFKI